MALNLQVFISELEHFLVSTAITVCVQIIVVTLRFNINQTPHFLLTETIMNRSDSLPHVIEEDGEVELPYLEIKNQIITNDGVKLTIETNGDSVMLIVNEVPSGVIDGNDIEIGGLDLSRENTISLIPLKNNRRGQAVNVSLDSGRNGGEIVIPNTPDTGAI